MKKSFESYLIDKHADSYVGLDDEMPDDFNWWLENLEPEDYYKYAEKWHNSEMRRVLEGLKKEFAEFDEYSRDFIHLIIDKELEEVK